MSRLETDLDAEPFPAIDSEASAGTREALHAYARILGNGLKSCRPKRKHWWHASLRPSLFGLTTGVVRANVDFELELDLRDSLLHGRTSNGRQLTEVLRGQPAANLAASIQRFLDETGVDVSFVRGDKDSGTEEFTAYSPEQSLILARALNSVVTVMEAFQAGVREETSPIQLWPHHFDVSMLWLPGGTVPGANPQDEEYSDPQMNFGFTFGDQSVAGPYFYVTAYPLPDALPGIELPAGTTWHSEGFDGVVLPYGSLSEDSEPGRYLLSLWDLLLSVGRRLMKNDNPAGSMR